MIRYQFFGFVLLAAISAQSPAQHILLGDQAYAAFKPKDALRHYEAAIAADPKNVEALWKASRTAVVIGEFADSTVNRSTGEVVDTARSNAYHKGEEYGRRAVAANGGSADAHFALAMALGRIALTLGNPQGRLPYSRGVYDNVNTCLKIDPKYVPCIHILGAWHAEAMRVPSALRTLAVNMLGAKELATASWEKAEQYLLQAVQAEPNRAVHHLDLGRVYADTKDTAKARVQFEATLQAPIKDFNDPHYKAAAKQALRELARASGG